MVNLPYFDYLLDLLEAGNDTVAQSFGRHVHWGYWEQPEHAASTAADFAQATENLSDQLCKTAKIRDGLSVLDVGCGFGGTIAQINEQFSDMKLCGLNLDERQLQRARQMINAANGNSIVFHQGDACALPYPDQSFDIVLAVECIFHFPDRRQFFTEARRVLKPGGRLALSDFLPASASAPFTYLTLPKKFVTGFYGKCDVQYSARRYRQLAEEMRFTVETERNITANTLPTYRYLRTLRRHAKLAPKIALLETAGIELLSRLGLIDYCIYGFVKSNSHS